VNFGPDIGPDHYRDRLGALPPDQPVSLYIHVPFCERLCWYCGCHTSVTHRRGPIVDYVQTLIKEIELITDAIPHRPIVESLHLGGGSPNMLAIPDLKVLFGSLRKNFAFSEATVIAAEMDPRSLIFDWVKAAADMGLNRACLGVQDMNPRCPGSHQPPAISRHDRFIR